MDVRLYILMTCSITTVLSFPLGFLGGSKYLDQEIVMCDKDLNTIANNMCTDIYPDFIITAKFHPGNSLGRMCCAPNVCTAGEIREKICSGQRTKLTIPKATKEVDIYPNKMDYWYGSFILG